MPPQVMAEAMTSCCCATWVSFLGGAIRFSIELYMYVSLYVLYIEIFSI